MSFCVCLCLMVPLEKREGVNFKVVFGINEKGTDGGSGKSTRKASSKILHEIRSLYCVTEAGRPSHLNGIKPVHSSPDHITTGCRPVCNQSTVTSPAEFQVYWLRFRRFRVLIKPSSSISYSLYRFPSFLT